MLCNENQRRRLKLERFFHWLALVYGVRNGRLRQCSDELLTARWRLLWCRWGKIWSNKLKHSNHCVRWRHVLDILWRIHLRSFQSKSSDICCFDARLWVCCTCPTHSSKHNLVDYRALAVNALLDADDREPFCCGLCEVGVTRQSCCVLCSWYSSRRDFPFGCVFQHLQVGKVHLRLKLRHQRIYPCRPNSAVPLHRERCDFEAWSASSF